MANPKDIIEEIRRTEYLVGARELPENEKGTRNLRGMVNRMLKILSKDLNTKETHFVLELVQNADDNTYPSGIRPEIAFSLEQNLISVANNEAGFQETHVRALCNVGSSTKAKAKSQGFIGEKGIGFKSVFTVCDKPEIHSGGFHFRFSASDDNLLGYVVPEWIDGGVESVGTRINLPARDSHQFSSANLADLTAELLLFLRRLRRLRVDDLISGTEFVAERYDEGQRTELKRSLVPRGSSQLAWEKENFLCIHHKLSCAEVTEEKRPGILETEIVLAFPLRDDGSALADKNQLLFAFLPVRAYGFRFLVQGDFLLIASREDIHRTRPWNTKIRNQIAEAFVAAVPSFREDKALTLSFLGYVPDASDFTDEFFRVAADQIVERLKQTEFVAGSSGEWRKPVQVLLADDEFKDLFPANEVWSKLSLDYPSLIFSGATRKTLIRLGAVEASLTHVLSLLEGDADLAKRSPDWFAQLYQYLEGRVTNEVWLKKLRALDFVRLDSGKLTKTVGIEIFFPLTRGRKYGFEKELNVLDEEVLAGSVERSASVQKFLGRLGVRKASPYSLIRNHILPRHAAETWKDSDFSALTGHIRYIKANLKQYLEESAEAGMNASSALEQLATGLNVRTSKEVDGQVFFGRPRTLYLSKEYSPEFPLERYLGDKADPGQFVADHYLPDKVRAGTGERSAERVAEWRTFLYAIGVNRLPIITTVNFAATVDYDAGPELAQLLASSDVGTVKAILKLIDRNWSHYKLFCASRAVQRGRTSIAPSRFVNAVRQVSASTTKKKRARLSDTYLNTDAMRVVFGKSPDYLDASVEDLEFLDAVGVTHRIDAAACFKRLDQLREASHVSIKEVRGIYRALEAPLEVNRSEVESGFDEAPRLFVLSSKKWCTRDEVVWESNGDLLDSLFPPLEKAYSEHRTFLYKGLSIPLYPPEDALIAALEHLPEYDVTPELRRREAYSLYRRLSSSLRQGREEDTSFHPAWLDRMKSENLFFDHVGRLVRADDNLYVDDDARLAALFSERPEISILAVDRTRISAVQALLDACEIPVLSMAVRYQLVSVSNATIDDDLTGRIRHRFGAIMRIVFKRFHGQFERAMEQGVWVAMSRVTVKRVANLAVEAKLADFSVPYAVEIYHDGNTIFLRADARSARDKICRELCFLIGVRDDFADSIHRVLFANSDEELAEFLEEKGVDEIPPDEIERLEALARKKLDEQLEGSEKEQQSGPAESADEADSGTDAEESSVQPEEGAAKSDGNRQSTDEGQNQAHTKQATSAESPGAGYESDRTEGPTQGGRASNTAKTSGPRPPTDRKRPSGRLLSYAEPKDAEGDAEPADGSEESVERRKVAEAAVGYVIEEERKAKNEVQEMPFNNEGFDILRKGSDGEDEFIEVKGLTGAWSAAGIILSAPELRYAERYRGRYFLYVVEFAKEPARRNLYRIQDPFGKTKQFRFDSGWKGIAVSLGIVDPAAGMKIEIENQVGNIVDVRRSGQFFALVVEMGGGNRISTHFVPGKMRLIRSE